MQRIYGFESPPPSVFLPNELVTSTIGAIAASWLLAISNMVPWLCRISLGTCQVLGLFLGTCQSTTIPARYDA
ncbi:hypothetical protein AAHA92_32085 [Salvia divinorum]|uniref:Uncharacterized protein n=1 Tax=Salvia divinorum TaxID=28513 RepID=A0ABD1FJJ3_SALDI